MAGTTTITKRHFRTTNDEEKRVKRYIFAWTSDASGNADKTTASTDAGLISGEILRVVFVPGSGGSQPTNLYDVTITDEASVDVLAGRGANLSNSSTTHICPGLSITDGTTTSVVPVSVCDNLTLNVTNAGNAKSGQVIIYVR